MKHRPAPEFSCEICVLAGGLSSRLGREKARLRLGPRTLLGHVRLQARALGLPVRVIRRDRVPRCGPLGGVYTALVTSPAEAVLFLACDMPFLTAETMARLGRGSAARRPAVFFVSKSGTVGFPFLVRRAALSVVEGQIVRKQLSLHRLAAALKAATLVFPRVRREEAFNVNTPADWEAARQLWRRRHGQPRHGMRGRLNKRRLSMSQDTVSSTYAERLSNRGRGSDRLERGRRDDRVEGQLGDHGQNRG